jgi:hypothetical protein
MPRLGDSNTGEPGVIRVNYPGQVGFLVKANRGGNKIHKVFYLKHYGGNEKKCFAAARKTAREYFKKNPTSRPKMYKEPSKRNSSGVVGVRKLTEVHQWKNNPKKKSVYEFVVASWSPKPGVQKSKRFSVDIYGEEVAWMLACDARAQGVQSLRN